MSDILQAMATVFSLINPVMCVAMFMAAEKGRDRSTRIREATMAMLAILVILLVAAFLGARLLSIFGISLAAFSVAGGLVLAMIGLNMLRGGGSETGAPAQASPQEESRSSLASLILFAASPGTIVGVITISSTHSGHDTPVTAVIAVVVVLAVTWIALILASSKGGGAKSDGLKQRMVTSYMGLIVLAMGIQFALTGLKTFFAEG